MRLDLYLVENFFCSSRAKAQAAIKEGRVLVDGKIIKKSSFEVENQPIEFQKSDVDIFVSRGGMKLEKALNEFKIDVENKVALDIGASTGGFSDCLIKHKVKKVYAVDSGKNQLHESLKSNNKIISIEETNARYIDKNTLNNEKIEVVVMDVSFISQTLFYEAVSHILEHGGVFITLIKPQFEVGKPNIGKNGIVKNEKIKKSCINDILAKALTFGFENIGLCDSPILGGSGNSEYLTAFVYK